MMTHASNPAAPRRDQRRGLDRRQAVAGFAAVAAAALAARVSAQSAEPADDGSEAAWTKFNLNRAGDDQLLTIPGVGDRMLREFREYRPYASILDYRRQIGTVADPADVAAWEAYLYVPVDPAATDAATLAQLPGVDADRAVTLAAAVPYADGRALLDALATLVSPAQAAAAAAYLEA